MRCSRKKKGKENDLFRGSESMNRLIFYREEEKVEDFE